MIKGQSLTKDHGVLNNSRALTQNKMENENKTYTLKERNGDLKFNTWNLKHKVIDNQEWLKESEKIRRKYRVYKILNEDNLK